MFTASDSFAVGTSVSAKILVVDDNESLCRSLEMIFRKKGFETELAHTGEEALDKISQIAFNLVILDLKLPDTDGITLLDKLVEKQPDVSVIMATGHASVETVIEALTGKAVGYVTKPIDMEYLLKMVSDVLEKQQLISEKLAAENALIESEHRYRQLSERSPQGIMILLEDTVIYANQAACNIVGFEVEELLHLTQGEFWNSIHSDDLEDVKDSFQKHFAGEKTDSSFEFRICRKDESYRYVEVFATGVLSEGKNAIQVVFIDRTQIKRAERNKVLHQREIEIYNSLLRHDLGNDLQILLHELDYMKMASGNIHSEIVESLDSAVATGDRMYNLITALGTPVDSIDNKIGNVIELIARQSEKAHPGIQISVTHNDDHTLAITRGSRLLPMVFTNLFTNSVKHAGKNTHIDVEILHDNDQCTITISDDGPGVDPKIQDTLFQRGVSTTGGGLGLYLSKKIIEAIDGTLDLVVMPGQGAQFCIRLPLEENSGVSSIE